MKSKNIRLIMELIFIFIIPLLICCLCINVNDTYVYDNSGNFQTGNKTISFSSPLNYTKEEEYINYLAFNQLLSNGDFTSSDGWGYLNCSFSVDSNYGVCNVSVVESGNIVYVAHVLPLIADHYYAISYYVFSDTVSTNTTWGIQLGIIGSNDTVLLSSTNSQFFTIVQATSNTSSSSLYLRSKNIGDLAVGDTISFSNVMLIDLTKMFGVGYEPSTLDELSTYIDLSYYHYYVESEEIIFYSDDIISSNYTYNYTYIGHIKSLFTNYLELNDSVVLDFIMCYTMIWLLMFIIWHLFYRVFDAVAHLVKTKGD